MMTMSSLLIKPMLAKSCRLEDIKFPCYVSRKLDGVRAIVQNGIVYSRSLKPIPNQHVQNLFKELEGYDGELIVGDPTDPMCFRRTTSAVMSRDGKPSVKFYVFDICKPLSSGYESRTAELFEEEQIDDCVEIVPQVLCSDVKSVKSALNAYLEAGYEGVIARSVTAGYKQGRSTLKSQELLKIKPYADAEAEVVGFVALMHNGNEAFKNELGQTAHSFSKEGLIEMDKLGALQVRDLKSGVTFNVGSGFTDAERVSLWSERENLVGKIVKYKFFAIGEQDRPRHPVFLGFRDKIDF